jgi:hypothetical protein
MEGLQSGVRLHAKQVDVVHFDRPLKLREGGIPVAQLQLDGRQYVGGNEVSLGAVVQLGHERLGLISPIQCKEHDDAVQVCE